MNAILLTLGRPGEREGKGQVRIVVKVLTMEPSFEREGASRDSVFVEEQEPWLRNF